MVNENIVLDYYLQLMADDEIEFLVGRDNSKASISACINALKEAESMHQKIEIAKDLWKLLFEASMSYIDKDKHGYDSLFAYFDEYVEFEELIFASDSFYRDHTIHCLWVYFLGEYLYRKEEFSSIFRDMMESYKMFCDIIEEFTGVGLLDKDSNVVAVSNSFVTLRRCQGAIRCVTALAHDLGYPLKKVRKINKSICSILPHFSIESYQEFAFNYNNSQIPFIEKFLEYISTDFTLDMFQGGQAQINEIIRRIFSYDGESRKLIIRKEEFDSLSQEERESLQTNISPRISILNKMPTYIRYADDFEQQQHGILSAFLLMKKLRFFRNMKFAYSSPDRLSIDWVDFHKVSAGIDILSAMADHTSEGYQIRSINTPAALLTFVDELEEFSRISRANQNRQYINQFCRTDLYAAEGWLCVDFIFDNKDIEDLNPETAFRGRCKRLLSLFDIPKLDESVKIRMRCIGQLPANENEYMLEIRRNYANIAVNGEEQDIPRYLKSRHYYAKDEFSLQE